MIGMSGLISAAVKRLRAALAALDGAGLVGWARVVAGAVATTVREWLGWQPLDPFEFMSAAMVADVKSGAMTMDHSVAINACITAAAGRPIRPKNGWYRCDTPLVYNTSGNVSALNFEGEGYGTVFDNRTGGPLIDVSGAGTPDAYARGLNLKGFRITASAPQAGSAGVRVRAQASGQIMGLWIDKVLSHGIAIRNDDGDHDASGSLLITGNTIVNVGGDAISCLPGVTAAPATSNVEVSRNFIASNGGAGVRTQGILWTIKLNEIAHCAGGGVVAPFTAAPSTTAQHLTVEGNELDDCGAVFIDLPALKQGTVKGNKLIYRANATGVRIGDGGAGVVTNLVVTQNTHQRLAGTVVAQEIGANASYPVVSGNYYPTTVGLTRFSDGGVASDINELGQQVYDQVTTFSVNVSGNYAPSLANGAHQRLVIVGNLNLQPPTGQSDGRMLEVELFNNTAGAVTVAMDPVYRVAGLVPPASGKSKTGTLRWKDASGTWTQIGEWSRDL